MNGHFGGGHTTCSVVDILKVTHKGQHVAVQDAHQYLYYCVHLCLIHCTAQRTDDTCRSIINTTTHAAYNVVRGPTRWDSRNIKRTDATENTFS